MSAAERMREISAGEAARRLKDDDERNTHSKQSVEVALSDPARASSTRSLGAFLATALNAWIYQLAFRSAHPNTKFTTLTWCFSSTETSSIDKPSKS